MGLMLHPHRRSRRAGFTLVEILAVVVIILILAGLILSMAGKATRDADIASTRGILSRIATAVDHYKAENGTYPPQPLVATALDFEYKPSEVSGTVFIDAWGNGIQYTYDPAVSSTYRLWSKGPDGKTGNVNERMDDISN